MTKPMTGKRDSRESSLTRSLPKVTTKDVGIVVYLKKMPKYNMEGNEKSQKEQIREAIVKGDAKFQWRHSGVTYETIYNGFLKRQINMDDIKYYKCTTKDFENIKYKPQQ